MKKQIYESPEIEFVVFASEDVITTSDVNDTTTALSGGNGGSDTIEGGGNPWQTK